MRESWPHAPPHYFTAHGIYIITAATLHRKPLFNSGTKLDFLRDTATARRDFVRHLHRELAIQLNRMDATPGRRVMYEFWDTRLTFEKSWLARLNYVHQNPVKHGLVPLANQYPWCSAAWFETNARHGFVRSVYSFKIDRIRVPDDF